MDASSDAGESERLRDLYDEETLAAIEAGPRAVAETPRPAGLGGLRHTGGAGAIVAAAMLGLGDVLEGRRARERPPIVADDPGQPLDPDALVDVDFDPGSPTATRATLRPRLP
jgi:hypothetical protein